MGSEKFQFDKSLKGHLLLPTLILASFLGFTGIVLLSTLLVDIASSLKVPIGTASQLAAVSSFLFLIIGFVMSALSIRFKHKSLFLFSVAIIGVGALVFFLASDFATALLSQILMGAGDGMCSIMTYSLIGELLPLEERGWAIGLIASTQFFAFAFFAPLSGFIESIAGWRSIPLCFIFPLSIACLALSLLVIPSKPRQERPPLSTEYSQAFKQIFSNKSAVACLVGTTFFLILSAITFYAVSFYRVDFSVSPTTGGILSSFASVGGIFGAVGGGRLINRRGRKRLAVSAASVAGIFAILFTFVPNIWVSVAFWLVSAFSVAMMGTALTGLVLEQVPEFRASMMSISMTFGGFGGVLSFIIGGLVLNLYANSFQLLMIIFGASGVASGLVVLLFAKDPSKTRLPTQDTA